MRKSALEARREARELAANARIERDAAVHERNKTYYALVRAAAGVHPRYGYEDYELPNDERPTPVGIVDESVTLAPALWAPRIVDAANHWRKNPGFEVLVRGPLPDLLPKNSPGVSGLGYWFASDYFFRVGTSKVPASAAAKELRAILAELGPRVEGRGHAETALGFWGYFRQLLRYIGDYVRGHGPVSVDPLTPTEDVERAREVARAGDVHTAEQREAIRRGLCALEEPGSHVAAYFGDEAAIRKAATALAAWKTTPKVAPRETAKLQTEGEKLRAKALAIRLEVSPETLRKALRGAGITSGEKRGSERLYFVAQATAALAAFREHPKQTSPKIAKRP